MANIMFHELCGTNVINLYSNTILALVLTGNTFTPKEGVYMISLCNTAASAVSIWTVKSFGRRTLLLWGTGGVCICHTMIATFIILEYNWGILVMICVFMIVYQNSSGPIAWVYAAETLTDVGLGVSLMTLYGTVFILCLVTEPLMNSALHPSGVFYLLAFFSFCGVIFLYFCFKETMGLTEKQKKTLYSPNYGKNKDEFEENQAEYDGLEKIK